LFLGVTTGEFPNEGGEANPVSVSIARVVILGGVHRKDSDAGRSCVNSFEGVFRAVRRGDIVRVGEPEALAKFSSWKLRSLGVLGIWLTARVTLLNLNLFVIRYSFLGDF